MVLGCGPYHIGECNNKLFLCLFVAICDNKNSTITSKMYIFHYFSCLVFFTQKGYN